MSVSSLLLGLAIVGRPTHVHWEAPPTCPDAAWFEREVAPLLSRREASGSRTAEASVVVQSVDGRYRAQVRVRVDDRTSERTLDHAECTVLGQAAALVVAVQLDALARDVVFDEPTPIAEPEPLPGVIPPAVAPARPSMSPVSPQNDRPRAPWLHAARLRLGVATGMQPGQGVAVGLGYALMRQRLRIDFHGYHLLPRTAYVRWPTLTAGAEIRGWIFGTRAAFVPTLWRFELPMGAGLELGDLVAEGSGVDRSRRRHALWAAGVAALELNLRVIPRLSFGFGTELAVAFTRPTFGIDVGETRLVAHRAERLSVRTWFAAELRFW